MLYTQIVQASGRSIAWHIAREYDDITRNAAETSSMTFGRRNHRRGNSSGA